MKQRNVLRLLSFLINTNFFIAFAAVFMTVETQVQLGTEPSWHPYLFIIFFATLFEYNLHKLAILIWHRKALEQPKHQWLNTNIKFFYFIMAFSVIGFTASIILAKREVLEGLFPFAIITVFYSIPFMKLGKKTIRLREIPGLKVFTIAVIWAFVTVFLPIIQSGMQYNGWHVTWMVIERFLFITAITIPFDVRDMETDARSGLKTLPLLMGRKNSLMLATGMLLGIIPIAILHYPAVNMPHQVTPLVISVLLTIYFINSEKLQQNKLYHYGILDGTIIMQALLVYCWHYLHLA